MALQLFSKEVNKYDLSLFSFTKHGGYCTAIVFIVWKTVFRLLKRLVTVFFVCFAPQGIDSIFMTTCFHISTQFKIISLRIENAFAELADKHYLTPAQNELMRQRLRDIVISQTKLMEITESFIRVFTGIILVHFISVALIIGIGSINLLTVNRIDFARFAPTCRWFWFDNFRFLDAWNWKNFVLCVHYDCRHTVICLRLLRNPSGRECKEKCKCCDCK